MREITRMQIQAAQHANALTGLPGNEPLNGMLGAWLESEAPFWVAYFDLDHFKPFNDNYSFALGDEANCLLAQALRQHCDTACDYVAHIGGDDFMVLFRSGDWESRCRQVLAGFNAEVRRLFSPEDLARGGYMAEDRRSHRVLIPLVSLSIGVVHVEPHRYSTYHQISAAAAVAKKEAKKISGNSLFIERREN
jgi:GGDEF domain-containing protein